MFDSQYLKYKKDRVEERKKIGHKPTSSKYTKAIDVQLAQYAELEAIQ